jgi:hypothetical protein
MTQAEYIELLETSITKKTTASCAVVGDLIEAAGGSRKLINLLKLKLRGMPYPDAPAPSIQPKSEFASEVVETPEEAGFTEVSEETETEETETEDAPESDV